MGVRFGREFGLALLSDTYGVQSHRLAISKWRRAAETFQAQRLLADLFPLTDEHDPTPSACCFKLYEEVPGEAEGQRELLIECKMALTRPIYLRDDVYALEMFPLRGTDVWAVIQEAARALGPIETMILSESRLTMYCTATPLWNAA